MQLGGSSAQAGEVPRLAPGCDPTRLPLSPAEGYLLSRIDGRTPWSLLRQIAGLPPAEVDRCLERWLREGVIEVVSPARGKGLAPPAGPPPLRANGASTGARPAPAAPAGSSPITAPVSTAPPPPIERPSLDAALDIALEAQERILAFEQRLGRPYHEILGVSPAADAKVVKRAYFELSKEFHPDRYFRRDIGLYRPCLERIFKKIVEAYELLSDPTTRAEIERARAEDAAAAVPSEGPARAAATRPAAAAAPPLDGATAEEVARAARRPASLPHLHARRLRALAERRNKSKTFFEAGMAAFREGRWLEASAAVRLAVAFDPANESMKESFAEVQHKAHEERAKQLVSEAEGSMEMRQYKEALGLYEEALFFRPHDAELNHKAARLAFVLGEDLKKAKEWAAAACELQPDVASHRKTLGQIYKSAGLVANARRELEAAIRMDPKDAEARDELRGLGWK